LKDIVDILIGFYIGMCLYAPLNDLLRAWRR
jgi:hypothetical protein